MGASLTSRTGEALARDRRKFVLGDAEEVVTRLTQANVDLPIDYEHQPDTRREDYTGPVPAAGWIKELAARADGLWGRVEWTGRAAQMIRDKEYRYLSPSLLFDEETRHVFRRKGAGLVHRPALHLTALASEEDDMDGQDFMQAVMICRACLRRRIWKPSWKRCAQR